MVERFLAANVRPTFRLNGLEDGSVDETLRARGFKSIGDYPDYIYFGGNSEMRGYDYLQFLGQNVVFANAELRFPIIEAALTRYSDKRRHCFHLSSHAKPLA